jgi:hypothetical protein
MEAMLNISLDKFIIKIYLRYSLQTKFLLKYEVIYEKDFKRE